MSETQVRQPRPIDDSPDLRKLHRQYVKFMRELGQERGREEFPCLDLDEFAAWLSGLDPVTQRICEDDFRKGYARVIEEGEKQVAEVIAKYEDRAEASGAL